MPGQGGTAKYSEQKLQTTELRKLSSGSTGAYSNDAFGRTRVSDPKTLFDSKLQFDKAPLFWDEETSGATETSTHSTTDASVTMTVNADTEYVIRQTFMRFNYQPAKSQLIFMTAVFGATTTDVTKRMGYFNSSIVSPFTADFDGYYWEDDGTDFKVVLSKTGTANAKAQSEWNLDRMNGAGGDNNPSGLTLQLTNTNIFFIDFEWLGVGSVRFGVVINGVPYYVHQFNHANINNSVYVSSPNHSIRYEIRSSGGTGSLEQICSSVQSEGGQEDTSTQFYLSRGGTPQTLANEDLWTPLVSVRLKSTHLNGLTRPSHTHAFVTTNTNFEWCLFFNPTVGGVDAASWSNVDNSSLQFDIARDNTNTLTGGIQVAGGYGSSSNQATIPATEFQEIFLTIGAALDGTQDELILAARNVDANGGTAYGAIEIKDGA